MKIKLIAGIVCALCASAFAQLSDISVSESSSKGDSRVRKALENAGLKYSVDDDEDFRLTFSLGGGRTHLVIVDSNTHKYQGLEFRTVWARGFQADSAESISKKNLQTLLERNEDYKLGSWGLAKGSDGKRFANFRVMVPADCSSSALNTIVRFVAEVADEIEKSATGGADKF